MIGMRESKTCETCTKWQYSRVELVEGVEKEVGSCRNEVISLQSIEGKELTGALIITNSDFGCSTYEFKSPEMEKKEIGELMERLRKISPARFFEESVN